MENPTKERIITLKDLLDLFVKRFWVMVSAAVICMAAVLAYNKITFIPRYASTATLYILKQNEDTTSTSSVSTDFSLALNVVSDCEYLLKSHAVLDEVIGGLELNMDYYSLYKMISISNPDGTRILEVTAEGDTPEQAKQIVDKLCTIGTEKIESAMGFEQVNFYESGVVPEEPCNQIQLMTYLLIGIAAVILTYSIFLIIFLLDDTLRTDEDIETCLGLSILGDIPDENTSGKKKYGYYGYGTYGVYGKKEVKSTAKAKGRKDVSV